MCKAEEHFKCDDMEHLTGGLLTCKTQSEFTTSMDVHACSYECLQHLRMPNLGSSDDVMRCNRYT